MIGSSVSALRRFCLIAVAFAAIQVTAPASAQRGLVIDDASKTNTLTSCGTNCFQLTTSFGNFAIDPTGSIAILGAGDATFFAASSATSFQVLSGYTGTGNNRTDFVDFYQLGSSTAINSFGNRPAPDFQIQLRTIFGSGLYPSLEIAFAYAGSTGVNNIPSGATIGYRGSTLGMQETTTPYPREAGGFFTQNLVTNTDGLLLGQRPGDSLFVFVVGPVPDSNFNTVLGLLSETFVVNRAIPAVPEPSTWATMLLGFGIVGASLRLRRRRTLATA